MPPFRVVTLPVNGRPARAIVCACGNTVATLPGTCGYCHRRITPDDVDLRAWAAAAPARQEHAA